MATNAGSLEFDVTLNTQSLQRQARAAERSVSLNLRVNGEQPLGRLTSKVSEFDKSLEAANARVVAFGASAAVIGGVVTAIRSMVSESIKVEKALADINVLLGKSNSSLEQFGTSLFEIAKGTGQSFDEVAKAATEFSRQGLSAEETLKRTRDALILTRLSGLDAAKSVDTLTASVNSFQKEGLTTTDIINKLANVDARFAVSSKDLAEAVSRAGSAVQDAGNNFDEFIALVTAAQERTARGGAVIGNAFKSIFTRESRSKTLEQLEQLGVAVKDLAGNTLPAITILQNLAKQYDTLAPSAKTFVAELVGGVYQINILKATLADLEKANGTYARARQSAAQADDAAIDRNAELNKTLAALANSAQQNFAKISASAGKLIFGPSLEKVFKSFNFLTDDIGKGSDSDKGFSAFGKKLGEGLLKGIGEAISGPGIVIGGVLAAKLFGQFAEFSAKSLGSILRLGKASRTVEVTQEGINQLLARDEVLRGQIASSTISIAEKGRLVVSALQQELAINQEILAVKERIATYAVSQGYRFDNFDRNLKGPARRIVSRAGGNVPVDQLPSGAIENEVLGAKKAGYSIRPQDVRAMRAKIGGQVATVVYNTREKVINNYNGSGEPAIVPPNKTIGQLVNMASGGVNFGDFNPSYFPKTKGSIDAVRSFLKDTIGLKGKQIAKINFAGFSGTGSGAAKNGQYSPETNSIDIFHDTVLEGVSNYGSKNITGRYDSKLANIISHEGFHNAFAHKPELTEKRFSTLADKSFFIPKTKKEALKFLQKHYGYDAKETRERYGGYAKEEALAVQFPRLLGYAAGRKPKVGGRQEYSNGGKPIGYAEFKKQGESLILDTVGTYRDNEGNRQLGTGILGKAFGDLAKRAKAGGVRMVGFTPINSRVVQKARSLFGNKDSFGRPIDFGSKVRLQTSVLPETLFAAQGLNIENLSKSQLLALAKDLNLPIDSSLKKASAERARAIISTSTAYRKRLRQINRYEGLGLNGPDEYERRTRLRIATGIGTSASDFYSTKPNLRGESALRRQRLIEDSFVAQSGRNLDEQYNQVLSGRQTQRDFVGSDIASAKGRADAVLNADYASATAPFTGVVGNSAYGPFKKRPGPARVRLNQTTDDTLEAIQRQKDARNARFSNYGIALSFATPVLGGIASEFAQNPVNKRRISSVANGVGTGAALGSFFGPIGTAVGAVGGGVVGGIQAYRDRENSQDIQERVRQAAEKRQGNIAGAQNFAQVRGSIQEAIASGDTSRLSSLYSQLGTASSSISDPSVRAKLIGAKNDNELGDVIAGVNANESKSSSRDSFDVRIREFNEKFKSFASNIDESAPEVKESLKTIARDFVNAGLDINKIPADIQKSLNENFSGQSGLSESFKSLVNGIKESETEFQKLASLQKETSASIINFKKAIAETANSNRITKAVNQGLLSNKSSLAQLNLEKSIDFDSPFLTGGGLAKSNLLLGEARNRRSETDAYEGVSSEITSTLNELLSNPAIASTNKATGIRQAITLGDNSQIIAQIPAVEQLLKENGQSSSSELADLRVKLASIETSAQGQKEILDRTYQWEVKNLSREALGKFLGGSPFGSTDTSAINAGTGAEIGSIVRAFQRFTKTQGPNGSVSVLDNDAVQIRSARQTGGVIGEAQKIQELRGIRSGQLDASAQKSIQEAQLGLLPEEATFKGLGIATPNGLAARRAAARNNVFRAASERNRNTILGNLNNQIGQILPGAGLSESGNQSVRLAGISGTNESIDGAIASLRSAQRNSSPDKAAQQSLLINELTKTKQSLPLGEAAANVYANKAIANDDPTSLIKDSNNYLKTIQAQEAQGLASIAAEARNIVEGVTKSNGLLELMNKSFALTTKAAGIDTELKGLQGKIAGNELATKTSFQQSESLDNKRAGLLNKGNYVDALTKAGLSSADAQSTSAQIASSLEGNDSTKGVKGLLAGKGLDFNAIEQVFKAPIKGYNGVQTSLSEFDALNPEQTQLAAQRKDLFNTHATDLSRFVSLNNERANLVGGAQYKNPYQTTQLSELQVSKNVAEFNSARGKSDAQYDKISEGVAANRQVIAGENFNSLSQGLTQGLASGAPVSEQQRALARLTSDRSTFAIAAKESGGGLSAEETKTLAEMSTNLKKFAEVIGKNVAANTLTGDNPSGAKQDEVKGTFTLNIGGVPVTANSRDEIGEKVKEYVQKVIAQLTSRIDDVEAGRATPPTVPVTQ